MDLSGSGRVTRIALAESSIWVKRFVHRHRSNLKLPFCRWEGELGEEPQIDFGQIACVGRFF